MASPQSALNTFYNLANRSTTARYSLGQAATRLHQLTTTLTQPIAVQDESYNKFLLRLHPVNLEAARELGKLPEFASYLVSVLQKYEQVYFDDNGQWRHHPDTSFLEGFHDDELQLALRNSASQSLYSLAHEIEINKEVGLPVSPSLSEEDATKEILGKTYPVFRIPQAFAILFGIYSEGLATLNIPSKKMHQVYAAIKKERTQDPNPNPTTLAESLICLSAEIGPLQLDNLVEREAINDEWLLYSLSTSK
jgi:hypothetical protein